jgi:hypothetical protein
MMVFTENILADRAAVRQSSLCQLTLADLAVELKDITSLPNTRKNNNVPLPSSLCWKR